MPKSNSRYVSVKWFSEDGKPNIVADPTNRPLQQATVQEYVQRLFKSGLAADVAGLPWMRWSKGPGQHNWPWQALSFTLLFGVHCKYPQAYIGKTEDSKSQTRGFPV